jgi:uridine kinase
MKHASSGLIEALEPVASRIRARQRNATAPLVVAIDGRSGAGKSTVASLLTDLLDAACVPCDDFFTADIPAAGWEARTAAERASDALDWRRLRTEVIEPIRAGNTARWLAFDFAAGARPDGTYAMRAVSSEQPPRPILLLDGAYSTRPELADVIDVAILVEAPAPVRLARLAAREAPGFLEGWRARWDAAEEHYFTRVRPASTFDVVLRLEGVT